MIVYLGIDWSEQKHDLVFLNEKGGIVLQTSIEHTQAGFEKMDALRQKLGVKVEECIIGIETAHDLVLDYLELNGYTQIYLIAPTVVNACRGRFGTSGAYTDPRDARLIADILRTDRERLHRWQPNSVLTQQIKAQVRLIDFLTKSNTQAVNRLRAVLMRYYPQATRIFSELDCLIGLEFIKRYPTPEAAARLTFSEFKEFAKQHHYPHPKRLSACYGRLISPLPATVQTCQAQAVTLCTLLVEIVRSKNAALRTLTRLFKQHPDYAIFSSLPGAGEYLAPALLAKLGDDRLRFPTPQSLQAVAGACPVTQASGKRKMVLFRQHCDKEFRAIVTTWAMESIRQSVWANTYFQAALPHCHTTSHAYRRLANRWLGVVWRLWQDRLPYDEEYHLQQRALRAMPRQ